MSDELDFEALLDTNTDDIKEPLQPPEGSYIWTVSPNKAFGKSSKKETPYVEFELVDPEPQDDVDMELFEEALATRKNGFSKKVQFYLTDAALFMLKNFFKEVGVDMTGRSLRDCLDDISGEQVGGYVKIEVSDNGRHYFNIDSWFAA